MRIRGAVLREMGAGRPYSHSRPLALTELELDPPGPGELLVRMEAAGLCHSDLSVVDGNRPRPLPMLLGHEAAGTVVEVGDGVHDIHPGQHVVLVYVPSCGTCGYCSSGQPALCAPAAGANTRGELVRGGIKLHTPNGDVHHHLGVSAFASHAVVDRNSVVAVDPDVPFDVAALFGCAMLTGFGAVTRTGSVQPGDSVAVFGLGGVGQAVVMSAVAAGAYPVIGVDPVVDKQRLALRLGASHAGGPEEAPQLVDSAATGGVDWAFEVVGSAAVLESAYALTGRGGSTVSVGLSHPDARVSLPALSIVAENRSLLGSYMGSAQPQRDVPTMVKLWRAGRLPVEQLKDADRPLDEINDALEELAAGSAVRQIIRPAAAPGVPAG